MFKNIKSFSVLIAITVLLSSCTVFATPLCWVTNPRSDSERSECKRFFGVD